MNQSFTPITSSIRWTTKQTRLLGMPHNMDFRS